MPYFPICINTKHNIADAYIYTLNLMHGCCIYLYLVSRNLQNIPVTGFFLLSLPLTRAHLSVFPSFSHYICEWDVCDYAPPIPHPPPPPPPPPYYLSLFCTNCIYNTNENAIKFLHVIKKWWLLFPKILILLPKFRTCGSLSGLFYVILLWRHSCATTWRAILLWYHNNYAVVLWKIQKFDWPIPETKYIHVCITEHFEVT